MHRNKQIFKTNFSLNIIQNNLLVHLCTGKKKFFIEKKFQKFNYFYGFFLYKFSGFFKQGFY